MSRRTYGMAAGLLCAALVGVTLPQSAAAQEAQLRGVVHDSTHRPIAYAQVMLENVQSQDRLTVASDASGAFQMRNLPAGEYRVRVEAAGFTPAEQTLEIAVGSARVLHFELAVGGAREEVHVTDRALQADATSATTQTTITRAQIESFAGADQTNSLRLITEFVPGSYVVHDQLHVRGGHQVTWALDGVPLPNTNIASNVGPQFDPKDIDSLDAQTSGYSAGFGDRTYGIFNVATRTGFERDRQGELVTSFGTYNATNDQLSLGDHSERFAWYASANGNRTGYGLEPPTQYNPHNLGDGGGGFLSLLFNRTAQDQVRLDGGYRADFYQVPNDPDQQAAGARDREREQDGFAIVSFTHQLAPGALVTVSPLFHANRAAYVSGGPLPVDTTDDRVSYYEGGQATLAYEHGPSNLRAGTYAFAQQDTRLFALTSGDGSASPFRQTDAPRGQLEALFVDDQWKVRPWWTLNGGLRYTNYHGQLTEHAWDPRAGTAITLPRLGWVLRGSYGRYYQAPPLDTVTGAVLSFAASQQLGFLPLHGERDAQYDAGLVIPLRGWTASFDNFRTTAQNFFDHNAIGNSNLFFPLTIDRARIRGWEANVRSPRLWNRAQAHLIYSNQQAQGFGAITGGITDFSPPAGGFYLDHDQRNSLTSGFDTQLPWRTDAAFDFIYGSGFLTADGPQHLPSYRTFDLALNKSLGERWTLRAIGTNITNKRYQLDQSSTFGGSHVGDPRMLSVEARYRFHF
jgi:outer membrane receptor protein involved in Fe transport